ncbi:MAG: M20/M25/M40 family metallo-hydrolase [Anaerolineae bacterium]|nr:M20/M25/M40 family metallo-hydrolase [Anaerolineae bacterium]NUQ03531.1 M20/M25/M40 family metallo-hydrolase [Anaerolineae bacterium]
MNIDERYTLDSLRQMVRTASVNPTLAEGGMGEQALAEWLAAACERLGFLVEVQDAAPGRPNVIARHPGTGGGRSLLLTGHTDTVGTLDMTIDPFGAEVREGRLYGRGSQDMKGGLAAILGAARALVERSHAGDLILAFVVDEEYASIGASALVERVRADAAILTEPTDERLCIAHKGFAWLTLRTEGRAAHGSLYNTGIDAIAHMGRLVGFIERLERDIFPQQLHPLLGRASVHASSISGGLGLSTYPDACTLQVEHRLLPDDSPDALLALWQAEIDRYHAADPAFEASIALDLTRPGYDIAPDAPIVEAMGEAIRSVTAEAPEFWGMPAWLDSAIIGRAGTPTAIYGPRGAGMHGAEEYVEVESVIRCAQVIASAAAKWLA